MLPDSLSCLLYLQESAMLSKQLLLDIELKRVAPRQRFHRLQALREVLQAEKCNVDHTMLQSLTYLSVQTDASEAVRSEARACI